MSFLCLFLLALPVFFKYVVVYRGAYLKGGIMLSLFISGILCQSVLYLALISMVSMGMLNFGCSTNPTRNHDKGFYQDDENICIWHNKST